MTRRVLGIATAAFALLVPTVQRAEQVNYAMVRVADAGNAADTSGYGSVGYEYGIGKYFVTVGQ